MRYLLAFALLAGAILFYAMGVQSGAIALLIIGFVLEVAFWMNLIPRKRRKE